MIPIPFHFPPKKFHGTMSCSSVREKKAILTPFIESSFCVPNELIWRGDNTLLPPNKTRFNPKSGGKAILKATDSIIKITSETGNGYVYFSSKRAIVH